MKAISLWQPWASLVAIKAKTIETRHWPAPSRMIGKRIAIHAAKRWTQDEELLCFTEPFTSVLCEHFNITATCASREHFLQEAITCDLPKGAIVATAILAYCVPSEQVFAASDPSISDSGWIKEANRVQAYPYEFAFGNLKPERYAWLLRDIEALPEPIPFKGAQGFFEVAL